MKLNDAVRALTALAQPSRLQVFQLLAARGDLGLCAGSISKQLKIPKPTLSFHLKELSQAGLIDSKRDGRSITYYLHVEGMRRLMAFLSKDCCQGRPDLCAPTRVSPPASPTRRVSKTSPSKPATPNNNHQLPTHLL